MDWDIMAITHQVGAYTVSDDVLTGIRRASQSTGVDFSYMMAKAARESSFRHDVRAGTSSATGLYQFIDQTWLGMVHKYGADHGLGRYADMIEADGARYHVSDPSRRQEILDLRLDPSINATMAGEYANENRDHLARTTSRRIGPAELYLAHFLGAGGASDFLNALDRDPGRSGAELFPAAANANRSIFYKQDGTARSLADIHGRFADQVQRDMAVAADHLPQGTAGSVSDFWTGGAGQGPLFGNATPPLNSMQRGPAGPVDPSVANASYWLRQAGGGTGNGLSLWTVLALSSMSMPGEASISGDRDDHNRG